MAEEVSYNSNTAIPMLICGLRCTGAPRYFQHKWCNMHCHENNWVCVWVGVSMSPRCLLYNPKIFHFAASIVGGEHRNSCCTLLHSASLANTHHVTKANTTLQPHQVSSSVLITVTHSWRGCLMRNILTKCLL